MASEICEEFMGLVGNMEGALSFCCRAIAP